MSLMLEPNPTQIKEERIYAEMGLTDEEFAMVEKDFRSSAKLYRNRVILCNVV